MTFFIDGKSEELTDFAGIATSGSRENPVEDSLVMIGDTFTGKSSLMSRFFTGTYIESTGSTIGVDFKRCLPFKPNEHYKLKVWDVSGQERFQAIRLPYYARKDAFLACFDVSNEVTFNHLPLWLNEVKNCNKDIPRPLVILVGTKADQDDRYQISDSRIRTFMALWNHDNPDFTISGYVATSAKTGMNVDRLLKTTAQMIRARKPEQLTEHVVDPRTQMMQRLERYLQSTEDKKDAQGNFGDFLFFSEERGYNRNIDCAIARQLRNELARGYELRMVFQATHIGSVYRAAVQGAGPAPGLFTMAHDLRRSSLHTVLEECREQAGVSTPRL